MRTTYYASLSLSLIMSTISLLFLILCFKQLSQLTIFIKKILFGFKDKFEGVDSKRFEVKWNLH